MHESPSALEALRAVYETLVERYEPLDHETALRIVSTALHYVETAEMLRRPEACEVVDVDALDVSAIEIRTVVPAEFVGDLVAWLEAGDIFGDGSF